MHLLHKAHRPFAFVSTPIFSRSQLSPPSSSSIISGFLLTVKDSGAEVLLPLLSLFACASISASVFLSTDCCCVDGNESCEMKTDIYLFSPHVVLYLRHL